METQPAKKPVPRFQFTLSAEHMSVSRATEAAKSIKGIRALKITPDEIFTGFVHVRMCGTKVQANQMQKALWEHNGGAFCEIKRGRRL